LRYVSNRPINSRNHPYRDWTSTSYQMFIWIARPPSQAPSRRRSDETSSGAPDWRHRLDALGVDRPAATAAHSHRVDLARSMLSSMIDARIGTIPGSSRMLVLIRNGLNSFSPLGASKAGPAVGADDRHPRTNAGAADSIPRR
jgi:hypothetical protein